MLLGGNIISSIEFHKNISLVIFMAGCPLRCRYCQNTELLEEGNETSLKEVKNIIDDSYEFIDAVVISGGEPLLQANDVSNIFDYTKKIGLKNKLDTSGIYTEKLKFLLDSNKIDFISLDIKAPFHKYKKIVGKDIGEDIRNSMNLINKYNVKLEARTTFIPKLHTKKDIENIVKNTKADIYTLQQFRNRNVLDPELKKIENPNPIDLKKLAESLLPYFDGIIKCKTAEFGEQIIK